MIVLSRGLLSSFVLSCCHTRRHCARQWLRHCIRSVAGYIEIHGSVNREAVPRSLPRAMPPSVAVALRDWLYCVCIFMLSSPIKRCRRHSVLGLSVRASVRAWSYYKFVSTKRLCTFQLIYNFAAVGDKLRTDRVKMSQRDQIWSIKHLWCIFAPISETHYYYYFCPLVLHSQGLKN